MPDQTNERRIKRAIVILGCLLLFLVSIFTADKTASPQYEERDTPPASVPSKVAEANAAPPSKASAAEVLEGLKGITAVN